MKEPPKPNYNLLYQTNRIGRDAYDRALWLEAERERLLAENKRLADHAKNVGELVNWDSIKGGM